MALDAAMLHFTANELKSRLVGARVDKLYMPGRDEVVFSLRTEQGHEKLLCNARSGGARVHITNEEFDNPQNPPAFCMLLRKHLGGGRITDIRAVDGDRILFIEFDTINELGDRARVTLSVELMGRYSNLVLVGQDGVVVDALKRIDETQSDKRQLIPGTAFTMPPRQEGKLSFFSNDSAALARAAEKKAKPLSDALLSAISGIGPALCREIAFRATREDAMADTLSPAQQKALAETIEFVKRAADGKSANPAIIYDGERPVEFSFIELTQYEGCRVRFFETASALFDSYYAERERMERAKVRSHDLKRQLGTILERTIRRQASRELELGSTEKADEKKLFGELLTANIHNFKKGDAQVEIVNYYTGESVFIPLDARLAPNQNAQSYYRDYRKLVTARKILAELLEKGESEIKYLESVNYEIDEAKTEQDFLHIRAELKAAGYLRSFKMPKKKLQKPHDFIRYKTTDGLAVVAGRNNAANEKLSLKSAARGDIWFHVKDAAGAHVVLETNGAEPSDRDYTEAAEIAAYNSSLRGGANVAVDYTHVRNLKKPPGSALGTVIYHVYNTAYVTPDAATIEQLLERSNESNKA